MARVPAGVKRAELIELLEIDEQIKALEKRKEPLADKAKRAHLHLPPETYVYGPVVFTLTEAKRFDPASFAVAYPFAKHPEYYEHAAKSALVPKELRSGFVIPERRLSLSRKV